MCLLSQRQDAPIEVVWSGRAGDYLREDLRIIAARYPARQPDHDGLASLSHRRVLRSNSERITRQIAREQRVARGQCLDCPNSVGDSEALRCHVCREKAAKKDAHRRTRHQRLGRCSRCHRRPRVQGCGLWCKWCWHSESRDGIQRGASA